jgi:quinol monooxygenase YgiN
MPDFIVRYADQSAMDKHMACEPVGQLLKLFSSNPAIFSDAPAIYGLPTKLSPSTSFTRTSLGQIQDPLIIFANFGYKTGSVSQAIPGWIDMVKYIEGKEEGTLTYSVIADEEKGCIRTVEAYESVEFLEGVHVKSEAVAANQKQNGGMRTGKNDIYKLRMIAGYIYKGIPEEPTA